MTFVYGTGRGLYRSNNLMGIIDHPMGLVAGSTLESTLSNQRRLWIGRTAELSIGFIELPDFSLWGSRAACIRRWFLLAIILLIELLNFLPRYAFNGRCNFGLQRFNRV